MHQVKQKNITTAVAVTDARGKLCTIWEHVNESGRSLALKVCYPIFDASYDWLSEHYRLDQ